MMKHILISAAALMAVSSSPAQQVAAAQSELGFTFKQMGVPVQGRFKAWSSQISFDPAKPEAARIQLAVDMGSATLGAAEVEAEVVKPDWFHTAKFPKAIFESRSVQAQGSGRYQVAGTLTIKGQPQSVVVPVTLVQQGATGTASGTLTIKRLDYKIGGGDWADPSLVANEVQVTFKLALTGLSTGAKK